MSLSPDRKQPPPREAKPVSAVQPSVDAGGLEASLSLDPSRPYNVEKVDGDVLVFRPEQQRAARQVAFEVMGGAFGDPRNDRLVGSIFGRSGAGKSEVGYFFRQSAAAETITVCTISLDCLYREAPDVREDRRRRDGAQKAITFEEYDWERIAEIRNAFRLGLVCSVPHIEMLTKETSEREIDFSQYQMLLLEGLYGAHPGIGADFSILVEQTDEKVQESARLRDKEKLTDFRRQIVEREAELVASLAAHASFIIRPDGAVVRPEPVN